MPQLFNYTTFVLAQEKRVFVGTTIKLHIERLACEKQDEAHRQNLYQTLQKRFNWSAHKLARVLNNTDVPTLEQLFVTAQLLGTSMDQLVQSGPRPLMVVA